MLFVTGGNGHFAASVIANLRASGHAGSLIVGTRDPHSPFARELTEAGIQVRKADFEDPASLRQAMTGAEKVLIIPTMAPNDVRIVQNQAAVEAARASGVRHLVYASFINASEGSFAEHNRLVHYPTEQAIRASGLSFTILRHALYAEMMTTNLKETLASGLLCRAGGDARCAYIGRDDLGISAARILASDGHEGRIYTETMAETVSGAEAAALMSEVFGTPVAYRAIPSGEWAEYMSGAWGVPLYAAQSAVGTMRAVETGEFDIASNDYAEITGHPPRTFRRFLEDVRDRS